MFGLTGTGPNRRRRASSALEMLAAACLIVNICGCVGSATGANQAKRIAVSGTQVDEATVSKAIDRSAGFLAGLCNEQGRFTYRIHLDPAADPPPAYNVLRHAGAVYALAQYSLHSPDPNVRSSALRAATYLRENCIAPVAGNPRVKAVWSTPEVLGDQIPRQAKLGGAGLGLIALLSVEKLEPGFTPLDDLRALGRFIIFMQKSDGSFFSKYFPDTGRSDQWTSMYYPGEAALGLLMLYEKDPAARWLRAATNALHFLARDAIQKTPTLPDQWYLLATNCLLALDAPLPQTTRQAILQHAQRVCRDMLHDQQTQLASSPIQGCFTKDGRSCPSATRLEGLQVALGFLPAEDRALKSAIQESVQLGMRFLLRCQVTEGVHAGAMPRVIQDFAGQPGAPSRIEAGEVRIDFVQHALSAMMQYRDRIRK